MNTKFNTIEDLHKIMTELLNWEQMMQFWLKTNFISTSERTYKENVKASTTTQRDASPTKHQQVRLCEICNGDHPTGYCPLANEEVNYMGNQNQYQQRQV